MHEEITEGKVNEYSIGTATERLSRIDGSISAH